MCRPLDEMFIPVWSYLVHVWPCQVQVWSCLWQVWSFKWQVSSFLVQIWSCQWQVWSYLVQVWPYLEQACLCQWQAWYYLNVSTILNIITGAYLVKKCTGGKCTCYRSDTDVEFVSVPWTGLILIMRNCTGSSFEQTEQKTRCSHWEIFKDRFSSAKEKIKNSLIEKQKHINFLNFNLTFWFITQITKTTVASFTWFDINLSFHLVPLSRTIMTQNWLNKVFFWILLWICGLNFLCYLHSNRLLAQLRIVNMIKYPLLLKCLKKSKNEHQLNNFDLLILSKPAS